MQAGQAETWAKLPKGGNPGDLYVYLMVASHKKFVRQGMNILSEVNLSYLQAILGCRLTVETVDGEAEVTVSPGTQPNTVVKLENKGVPKLGNDTIRGDHLITLRVTIPTRINSEERELLERLATIKGECHGKGGLEGFLGGIFHR